MKYEKDVTQMTMLCLVDNGHIDHNYDERVTKYQFHLVILNVSGHPKRHF